jgi:hypothetical protein
MYSQIIGVRAIFQFRSSEQTSNYPVLAPLTAHQERRQVNGVESTSL